MDLETVKITPHGEDWEQHRPLGISCAAFVSRSQSKVFAADPHNDQMTPDQVTEMVDWMDNLERHGAVFVTWNGLYFDWQVIAEESNAADKCQALALNHVDMMYHLFCAKGLSTEFDLGSVGHARRIQNRKHDRRTRPKNVGPMAGDKQ